LQLPSHGDELFLQVGGLALLLGQMLLQLSKLPVKKKKKIKINASFFS
jgi:hypothetical protein